MGGAERWSCGDVSVSVGRLGAYGRRMVAIDDAGTQINVAKQAPLKLSRLGRFLSWFRRYACMYVCRE